MPDSELFRTSLNKAMALCAGREYCIREVIARLQSWGTDVNDNVRIIGLLLKDDFINEERYALAYARDKFRYNKWGKVKIEVYLKAKNIPVETIRKALDTIDNEDYKKMLSNLLSTRRKSIKAKNQYDLKAKLMRYGLAKGFESSLLYDLLNDVED